MQRAADGSSFFVRQPACPGSTAFAALQVFDAVCRLADVFLEHLVSQHHGDLALKAAQLDQRGRSEEHTSELQSQSNLVCRLLLEKKKKKKISIKNNRR